MLVKKVTAAILAACLFCLFSTSVCAERVVGGENPNMADGVSDIPQGIGASSDIQVSVTDVASRYAVDVTFPDMTLSFGDVVWNVNSLAYEMSGTLPDGSFEITVSNHSDQPILMWGSVAKADPADGILLACNITADSRQTVPRVMPQASGPQEAALQVSVSAASGWTDVLAYLVGSGAGAQGLTYQIGTVSVFISKTN